MHEFETEIEIKTKIKVKFTVQPADKSVGIMTSGIDDLEFYFTVKNWNYRKGGYEEIDIPFASHFHDLVYDQMADEEWNQLCMDQLE